MFEKIIKKWILVVIVCEIYLLTCTCKNKTSEAIFEGHFDEVEQSEIQLIVHLKGVYESKIALFPLTGTRTMHSIIVPLSLKNGQTDTIIIPGNRLPGEYILNFNYKEKAGSITSSSEKHIIASSQDLVLWVHPKYCNNSDSTWFQSDERENTSYIRFVAENEKLRQPLLILQNFLLNCDDTRSKLFRKGVKEYEKQRDSYNRWIAGQIIDYQELFVNNIIEFQKIPEIEWKATYAERKQSLRDNYLKEIDLDNPLIVKTKAIKDWLDGYLELYDEFSTIRTPRDSLFTLAGSTVIEKVRLGHPIVYGWIVDYFYKKFESLDLVKGILSLQKYLGDPNCITPQKQVLQRRLDGKKRIIPGENAPDFDFIDKEGNHVMFHDYKTEAPYKLIVFWNSDCWECIVLFDSLYSWYQQQKNKSDLKVFAINLIDETQKSKWLKKISKMPDWEHMSDNGDNDSEVANAYCVLSTPVMILVNTRTGKIFESSENLHDLDVAWKLVQLKD